MRRCRYARIGQRELARRMLTSQATVSRWENGWQLPNLSTLEMVCYATGLELVIGLREPDAPEHEFVVLGVAEDEGNLTELRLVDDHKGGRDQLGGVGRFRNKDDPWLLYERE
ncbi:MAG: helix-turn-helix domain-containing protein [Actinomycetota bacterium]|nr:helix-turn-helix domain-containing protein [Actinomycetota bacterium]